MRRSTAADLGARDELGGCPHTVLVLDDDPHLLGRIKGILERHQFQVVCVQTTKAAGNAVATQVIALALIDYRLRGNVTGLDFAATLCRENQIPFVLISGYLNTELTVRAMRLGASDVIDKPFRASRLIDSVKAALSADVDPSPVDLDSPSTAAESGGVEGEESISSRWANLLLTACEARRDPKTVASFARAARVSTPVFRSVCDLCGIKPHAACTLGRFVRGIARSRRDRSSVISHLAIGDRRTATRLFETAGMELTARSASLPHFFRTQRIVSTDLECVRELAHRAANSPLFMDDADEE